MFRIYLLVGSGIVVFQGCSQNGSISHLIGSEVIYQLFLLVIGIVAIYAGFRLIQAIKKLNQEKTTYQKQRTLYQTRQEELLKSYNQLEQYKSKLLQVQQHLEQLDFSKAQLFKTISNDIQNPLSHLQQKLTNLINSDLSEDKFQENIDNLTDMVEDISLLLENLLQWSKYQSQEVCIQPAYHHIFALVDEVIAHQKYAAKEKGIELVNNMSQQLTVYADETTVKAIIKTLLQNTIGVSEKGAKITFTSQTKEHEGVLMFHYFSKSNLQVIGFPIGQPEENNTDLSEIGKAIILGWRFCQSYVQLNNGHIGFERKTDYESVVSITLPLNEENNSESKALASA